MCSPRPCDALERKFLPLAYLRRQLNASKEAVVFCEKGRRASALVGCIRVCVRVDECANVYVSH